MQALVIVLLFGMVAGCAQNITTPEDDRYRQFRKTCRYSEADCRKEWQDKLGDENAARRVESMSARNAERKALEDAEDAKKRQEEEVAVRAYQEAQRKAAQEASAAVEQQRIDDESRQKKTCGKDFGVLRVGMTLERFEKCSGAVMFVTDSMTANGVVETYRSTFHYLLVKNGRIVSYTRRTR